MKFLKKTICIPGQRLSVSDERNIAGQGTYEKDGYIYSTLAGIADIIVKDGANIVEVQNSNKKVLAPAQGDIVTAKVTQITQQYCRCVIQCIGDSVVARPYRAILRKEDIRATEKDMVKVYDCFRPGDIILARVLPINEAQTFSLTTAENELGVVIAHSTKGDPMVPMGWNEMMCPTTLEKQPRKVAKVVPETITN